MKKVLSILFAGVIALMATACYPDENFATFDPSKATAPVLGSYEMGDKALSVAYTPGKFNMGFNDKMPVNHMLVITSLDGKAVNKVVATSNKDNVLTASVTALSNALVALGCQEDQTVSFEAIIRATMQNPNQDTGLNGYIDSKDKISVTGFVVTFPKGNPWAEYTETSPWGLIGSIASTGNAWNADGPMFSTADGTKHVARNVKLTPDDQFKVRKDGGWDTNFGAPGDVEPFFMTIGEAIEATPGGKNLGVPAEGNYDLLLDEAAGTLTLFEAFQAYPGFDEASTWGVTGSIESAEIEWDVDVMMTTDGEWHVAEGVVLKTSDQFKFRNDRKWDENFGAPGDVEPFVVTLDVEQEAVGGGKNLAVPADGTYDLLVNPSAGLYKVVESLGGKSPVDRGEPEPPTPTYLGWGIIGDFNEWGGDAAMTESGGVWTGYFTNTEGGAFKVRKDASWDTNLGAIGDVEPYMVTLGTPVEAVANGKNLGAPAGFYKVVLDLSNEASPTITVYEGNVWSLIGTINGSSWDKDFLMTEKDGIWTSSVVTITGGFKIRHNFSWSDANTCGIESGASVEIGKPITLVQPGSDIVLPESGDYKIQFNPATLEMTVTVVAFPEQLYMIGAEFGGWDWNSDGVVEMTPVLHNPDWGAEAEGQFWTVRYFTAGQGFKFNSKRAWGGDFWGLTTNDGFTEDGGNCVVAEDGYYLVHIDLKREMVHVEPARIYGIGSCFGGWNEGMEDALFKTDGKTLKATTSGEGEVRMYAASAISTSDWWTREFVFFDGKIAYRGNGGDQERVTVLKGQEITLDFNAGTAMVTGGGEAPTLPETMYIIGDGVGGWDWAADYIVSMTPVNGKRGQFWAIRNIEAGKGFKFCAVKEWSGDFTGLGTDTGYTVSDGNCFVAETGVYMIYVDTENKKLCVERAKVYGIGDCFGGWNEGMEAALFTEVNGKLVGKTTAAGDIRLYAASSIATTDWWTREFVFFNGVIAYRGNGGDQERVSVEAGKTVTLDFNAGTASVE